MSALVWLTWRQHRWTILAVVALALGAAFALVITEMMRRMSGSMPIGGFYGLMVQLVFGGVVGMFWGAPLIARELEERTYFVAWGQDVSPLTWLRGKLLVLGALAVVLGLLVGLGDGQVGSGLRWNAFESHPLVQASYALFGLALGVLIGLLTRHAVTAIAATLVVYTVFRTLSSVLLRDNYLPPSRAVVLWDGQPTVPAGALELGGGFVGLDLNPVAMPEECAGFASPNSCMRTWGNAAGTYVDYQPVERIEAFRYIESGVYVLLAAALFALTFRLLRRGGGWKPSRSHRRIGPKAEPVTGSGAEPVVEPAQSTPSVAAAQAEG